MTCKKIYRAVAAMGLGVFTKTLAFYGNSLFERWHTNNLKPKCQSRILSGVDILTGKLENSQRRGGILSWTGRYILEGCAAHAAALPRGCLLGGCEKVLDYVAFPALLCSAYQLE